MRTKTKTFYEDRFNPIDNQINEFLNEDNRILVDVKLTGVNNTFLTQSDLVALLIYKEDSDV